MVIKLKFLLSPIIHFGEIYPEQPIHWKGKKSKVPVHEAISCHIVYNCEKLGTREIIFYICRLWLFGPSLFWGYFTNEEAAVAKMKWLDCEPGLSLDLTFQIVKPQHTEAMNAQ